MAQIVPEGGPVNPFDLLLSVTPYFSSVTTTARDGARFTVRVGRTGDATYADET